MQLIKNKYEGKIVFDSGEQALTFHYNSEGGLSIKIQNKVEEEERIDWYLNLTKDETADLVAFLHLISIL